MSRTVGITLGTGSGNGIYNLSGAAVLNVSRGIVIASIGGSTGAMVQSGGTVNADFETIG